MEKISIIVPCYNVESYVEKCIASIAAQTGADLEIICVNDGSKDRTLEILNKLASEDSRIKIINQENKGLSESRNVGISSASGDYIMFVDSDDWLQPDTISDTFSAGYDLICFSYNRIFRSRPEPRKLNLEGEFSAAEIQRRMVGLIGEELADPSQANTLVTVWGKFYNTAIIKENNLKFIDTKEIGNEDALFNIEYLDCCTGKVKIIDKPLYNYLRYNLSSFTTLHKSQFFNKWKQLHSKIYEVIEHKSEDFHQAFYNRVALSIIGLGLNELESNKGIISHYKNIKTILNDAQFIKAFQQLNHSFFPFHWKLLFFLAKKRNTASVLSLLKIMRYILKRKNN